MGHQLDLALVHIFTEPRLSVVPIFLDSWRTETRAGLEDRALFNTHFFADSKF